MTKTEDQLRDALGGIAELVHSSEKVAAPRREGAGRRRLVAWLAPAAVAAAVLLVVVVGIVAARSSPEREAAAVPAGDGRFFMSLFLDSGSFVPGAAVSDARTGKVITTVPSPWHVKWSAVGAAADSRTFFLAAEEIQQRKGPYDAARLYRLRLDDAGKVSGLTRIPKFTHPHYLPFIAVSPDGKSIAFPVDEFPRNRLEVQPAWIRKRSDRKPKTPPPTKRTPPTDPRPPYVGPTRIKVVNVDTGREQTYSSSLRGLISSLSWSADGRRLAIDISSEPNGGPGGVYVFEVRPGRDVLKDAIRVVDRKRNRLGRVVAPVISADGTKVYMVASQPFPTGRPVNTRVIEVDVATGRQLRVLFERRNTNHVDPLFTSLVRDPGGRNLLVFTHEKGHRIDLATARATRFPFPDGGPRSLTW